MRGNDSRAAVSSSKDDVTRIYHELKLGSGHELVNDSNVDALIQLAMEYGNTLLEAMLREWRSECGNGNATAPALARVASSRAAGGKLR